jgi:hypothetical protein
MKQLRKAILVTTLLLLTFRLMAPRSESLAVTRDIPIEPYRQLIHAIGMVETKWDTLAYNPVEQATGVFQIRPIRLKDYNKRTGSKYKMKDLFNYKISEEIFLYYAAKSGPNDFERIARKWNGSGSQTIYYWDRVKKHL